MQSHFKHIDEWTQDSNLNQRVWPYNFDFFTNLIDIYRCCYNVFFDTSKKVKLYH